jgi:hypothetical protein
VHEEELASGEHRHERRRVEAGKEDVLRAVDVRAQQVVVRNLLQREFSLVRGAGRPLRIGATRNAGIAPDVARLAKRVAEKDEGRRRLPPALPAPASPNSTNWKARARVIGSMSAPRSITAPWPAKMLLAVAGAITARVTPAARLTETAAARGFTAGATSIAALKGELLAWMSFVASTASTSRRPTREKPATNPGVTQRPLASIRCATVPPVMATVCA